MGDNGVSAYIMVQALNDKGYNVFTISVPSPRELLEIFMLAAPVFIMMMLKARTLLKSLFIIDALSGLILGYIGTSVPRLFPKIFSPDPEVIQEAGCNLRFISMSMTGIFRCGIPCSTGKCLFYFRVL